MSQSTARLGSGCEPLPIRLPSVAAASGRTWGRATPRPLCPISGQCVDMMNEPVDSTLRERVRAVAYPTTERGGCIWAYMGSRDTPPPLPDLGAVRGHDE